MTMHRKQLKENHNITKQFDYSKGDVSLKFSLRIDIKSQLRDFKELLGKALIDVNYELSDKTGHGGGEQGDNWGAGGGGKTERKKS